MILQIVTLLIIGANDVTKSSCKIRSSKSNIWYATLDGEKSKSVLFAYPQVMQELIRVIHQSKIRSIIFIKND